MYHTADALNITILADTNRDGKVDVSGDTDVLGKGTWTENLGAVFLANIGDTDRRCSKRITDQTAEEDLDKCHDASDNVQRNPKHLASLRTVPCAEVSASTKGFIHVTGELASENVRLFVKEAEEWVFISANHTFTAEDLKAGLELGIDSRDVRRPGGWNGKAEVHFTVRDGSATATDSVMLRVAPVLSHHHGQLTERVFTTRANYNNSQVEFVSDLKHHVAEAGISEAVFLFPQDDIWTQDFFEPGYTSMPGPNGPIMLRVMIRSAQRYRPSGRQVFQFLRSDSVGAVQHLGDGDTTDSTGNLETIPPYTYRGKAYPAGRIIMGSQQGVPPVIFPFLQAQETQAPLELDTSWLAVGHVDEFLQFLPAKNERGWVLMADDPLAGLDILRKASAEGHGSVRAYSRGRLPHDPSSGHPGHDTIDEVFQKANFTGINHYSADRIQANIDILKRETGITDDDIIRVPSLFYFVGSGNGTSADNGTRPSDDDTLSSGNIARSSENIATPLAIVEAARPPGLVRRQVATPDQVIAHHPGTVNGLVLTDSQVLAPNPWGPVVDGKDILAEAVSMAYAKAGFNITFVDDWFSHHLGGGEVHCGSNSWRRAEAPWW
ncbi:hypothetical protein ACJ41O_015259 [Fusarium nematophilum]